MKTFFTLKKIGNRSRISSFTLWVQTFLFNSKDHPTSWLVISKVLCAMQCQTYVCSWVCITHLGITVTYTITAIHTQATRFLCSYSVDIKSRQLTPEVSSPAVCHVCPKNMPALEFNGLLIQGVAAAHWSKSF